MKRIALVMALLAVTCAAFAQSIDVSSQPVPGLFNSNDTRAAIKMAASHRNLSAYVQKCYFNPAREYPIGSVDGYQAVAFCAEVDMAGIILNQHAAQSDPYFDISTAENRIGTELIALAGLNTFQAYQTNIWLKAAMTQWVREVSGSRAPAPQLSGSDQVKMNRALKAVDAMNEATDGPEKILLSACAGERPPKGYLKHPLTKSICVKYLKTFGLDSSYYHPITTD
jgi:hypothetical protein